MKTFINEFLPKVQDHGLDIFYLSSNSPDFFVSDYRNFWVNAIKGFRSIYSGALSNSVGSTGMFLKKSLIEMSSIWDLLDGIGFWVHAYISNEPIYNIDEIVSGYFGSKLNGTSVVNEIISASLKLLKVSPDQLRFGRSEANTTIFRGYEVSIEDQEFLAKYFSLSTAQKSIVRSVANYPF